MTLFTNTQSAEEKLEVTVYFTNFSINGILVVHIHHPSQVETFS
jgi:hypothetical protein